MNFLLDAVNVVPIESVLSFDAEGTLHIRGKKLDVEQAIVIREGADALMRNETYRLIKEQIAFEAIKMGVHSSVNTDMLLFAKAALWIQEQERKKILELSGEIAGDS